MPFEVGTEVQLKSGGPNMTVHKVDSEIRCVWFDKRGHFHEKSFDERALEKATPSRLTINLHLDGGEPANDSNPQRSIPQLQASR